MDNRIYGYARVSTREQNEDRQLEALIKFGVPEQNIIIKYSFK
ncbi:recombinase family protein [Ruminococcus sp.]|nr:recombinase family protein [Ruminococcus sp.]